MFRPHHYLAALTLLLGLAAPAIAQQQAQPVEKNRLGVAPPRATRGVEEQAKADRAAPDLQRLLDALDSQLVDRFAATRKFEVVARRDLADLQREQELAGSGNVAEDDQQAAEAFKLAGCKYLVVVELDTFQDVRRKLRLEARGTELEKRIIQFGAVAKLYDTTSGALLESYNDVVEIEQIEAEQLREENNGTMLARTLRDAAGVFAQRAANRVTDVAFPAKIIAATSGVFTINRGDGTDVRVGDFFTVYGGGGEPLVDPDTGEVLGVNEIPLGDVRIVRVEPKFCQAVLVGDDRGIDVGMVARPNYAANEAPPAGADDRDAMTEDPYGNPRVR